jgi:hypothetical protein
VLGGEIESLICARRAEYLEALEPEIALGYASGRQVVVR